MSAANPMDSERRRHHHGGSGEVYRECLRNHAASLGSYATDGCGEFTSDVGDDYSLQCAACGCHRNFHRKVPPPPHFPAQIGGHNAATVNQSSPPQSSPMDGSALRRRSRTKLTGEQKERMTRFAEKLGWRMQRRDGEEEAAIEAFCADVGVSRQVFKVWMHNHKNSAASSSTTATPTGARNHGGSSSLTQS